MAELSGRSSTTGLEPSHFQLLGSRTLNNPATLYPCHTSPNHPLIGFLQASQRAYGYGATLEHARPELKTGAVDSPATPAGAAGMNSELGDFRGSVPLFW
jgi:hypothetical protein